jgi:DNA-binding CsgD family transcriptional regulator
MGNLAGSLLARGEFAESARLAEKAGTLFRELDQQADLGWALAFVGPALAGLGRTADAVEAALESGVIAIDIGLSENVASAIWASIPVAIGVGRPELAGTLYGALITGMLRRGDVVLNTLDTDLAATWLHEAERRGGALKVQLALAEGERADPIGLLRSLPSLLRRTGRADAGIPILRHGVLTRREVEILGLVGRGRSDPEIGRELFISPKTASVHVANIKAKLGLDSRLQVALRARELGLADERATVPAQST